MAAIGALREAHIVHAFWPALGRGEVDIRPLIMYLRALSKQIALPMIAKDTTVPTLHSVLFESEFDLRPNQWGILEPATEGIVDRGAIDALIVPALGANPCGTRLGYGSGYYDSYLADMRATVICPIYDACLLPGLEAEPHDISVHMLVTETQTLHCSDQSP